MRKPSSKNSFSHLVREEFLKRFEGVVSDENRRTNDFMKETQDSLQEVLSLFTAFKNDLNILKDQSHALYEDSQKNFFNEKNNIGEILKKNNDSFNTFSQSIHNSILEFKKQIDDCVSKRDFDEAKQKIGNSLNSVLDHISNTRNELLRNIEENTKLRGLSFEELKSYCFIEYKKCCEKIDSLERKLEASKVDSEGILRELNIHKRSVLIAEKKIENLYTLIDRMKKSRGE